jgi:hypothetical protein
LNFNTNIYHQQAPFSGAVAGEQVIKIQSSIAVVIIFSFYFDFSFASLNFDHPQNKKNQSRVFLNPSFLLVLFLFIFANPNQRWTATSPTKKHIFCGWSRKNFAGKGDVQHKI